MAFGKELQDFVAAFQAGYNMFKSKDEREWEKEKRQRERDRHQWGFDDRARQRERDSRSDYEFDTRNTQWRDQFNANERYRGIQTEFGIQDRQERRQLREDERQRAVGRDAGQVGGSAIPDPYNDFPDDNPPPDPYNDSHLQNGAVNLASYSPQGGTSGQAIPETAAQNAASNSGFNLNTYLRSTRASESGGNDSARNPNSTATGRYQFLSGTWNELAKKYPNLGLTRDGRGNADQQERAMMQFTYDNAEALDRAGIPVTNGTLYAAHFLGAGGARSVLRGNPGEYVANYVPREVIRANPFLRGMTVGQFRQWAERKGGGNAPRRRNKPISAARGGMVVSTPEEDEDFTMLDTIEVEGEAPAAALPERDAPIPMPRYEGAIDDTPEAGTENTEGQEEPVSNDPFEVGRRAVRDGLSRALEMAGASGDEAIQDPERDRYRDMYIKGYGSTTPQMIRQVLDKIDPEKTLHAGERNMMAIATVYKYYMDNGNPEGAKNAAAQMVQYYRRTAQQFGALAQAAAGEGDIDKAAQAAIAAYANIPNGRDFDIKKLDNGRLEVSVTDTKTGKRISRQVMSAEEFGAAAMQFNPATFEDEIYAAAGYEREKISKETGGKAQDAADALEDVDIDAYIDEVQAASGVDEQFALNPRERKAIGDIAADFIRVGENAVDADLAVRLATDLFAFNPTVDDDEGVRVDWGRPFSYRRRTNSDVYELSIGDRKLEVSKGTIDTVEKIRARIEKDLKGKELEDIQRSKDRSSVWESFGNAFSAFGEALRGSPDQGVLPDDQQPMPITRPFQSPFYQDEPDDPSHVPEPDQPIFVR